MGYVVFFVILCASIILSIVGTRINKRGLKISGLILAIISILLFVFIPFSSTDKFSFLLLIGNIGLIVLMVIYGKNIGKRIGNSLAKMAGLILGFIFIILGIIIPVAILLLIITSVSPTDFDNGESLAIKLFSNTLNSITFFVLIGIFTILTSNKDNRNIFKNNRLDKFCGKNIEDILKENNMDEYIEIFQKNKLVDFEIISKLNDSDFEKIGINILGDRKKIINIFSKD